MAPDKEGTGSQEMVRVRRPSKKDSGLRRVFNVVRLNQYFRRDTQTLVKVPDHLHRKRASPVKYL